VASSLQVPVRGFRGFLSSSPLQGIQGLPLFKSPSGDSGAPPLQVPSRGFRGFFSSSPLQGIQGLPLFKSPSGDSGAPPLNASRITNTSACVKKRPKKTLTFTKHRIFLILITLITI